MGIDKFRKNVEAALQRLSKHKKGDEANLWLNERALAGMAKAGLETLPADSGFQMGAAVARFQRIAREVAEANGFAEREQSEEASAALRTIGEILKSLPTTNSGNRSGEDGGGKQSTR
jgi:hypothetical protein